MITVTADGADNSPQTVMVKQDGSILLPTFDLTVDTIGSGTVSGGGNFAAGTTVTLTATPILVQPLTVGHLQLVQTVLLCQLMI